MSDSNEDLVIAPARAKTQLEKAIDDGAAADDSPARSLLSDEKDYLCVRVGGRLIAMLVNQVSEVVPPGEVTPVPHTPAYVPGVQSMHGRVVAIFDLAAYLQERAEGAVHRIVVMAAGGLEAGVPVQEVVGIQSFTGEELQPVLPGMDALGSFVRGHLVWNDRVFIVIDVQELLASTRCAPDGVTGN